MTSRRKTRTQRADQAAEPETPSAGSRPWWREHIGWILGGAPIALAVVRIWYAARFVPETAAAIVTHGNPLAILAGAFFDAAPLAAVYGTILLWRQVQVTQEKSYVGTVVLFLVAMAVTTTALLSAPAIALGGWVLLGLYMLALVIRGRVRDDPWQFDWDRFHRSTALLLVGLAIIHVLQDDTMWLPPERLTVDNGPPVVGYVLDDGGRWTTVLTEGDRAIAVLEDEQVTGRRVCQTSGPSMWTRTLPELRGTSRSAQYPECPDD